MPGTLGQSTTHGDGRDDAPLCKNASAGCPTFWAVPSNPPPESPCQRGPNPAGGALSHPPNHPSLHVCPDVRRRDHSKATYYLAEVMRARARHSLAGDGRSHPLPILQRKFFRLGVLVSDRGAFLCQFNYALLKDLTVFLSSCLVGILGPGAPAAISAYVAVNDPLFLS